MKTILIIEDDAAISKGIGISLEAEGYKYDTAGDGEKGYERAKSGAFDLIILDLMLPYKNGLDICRQLRQENIQTPVIILTSKSDEIDKVLGLEIGADDYMTKPFGIRELLARIKAVLRRKESIQVEINEYDFGNVHINFRNQEITKDSQAIRMSVTEFKLLHYLLQHKGQVVTRDMLLDEVWGYDIYPNSRTVDNYILSLRKKLEDKPSDPRFIFTVPKAGYKFVPE